MSEETEKKIKPTKEFNELRYRELHDLAESLHAQIIQDRIDFAGAYKKFYKNLTKCARVVKEMKEELTKTRGF